MIFLSTNILSLDRAIQNTIQWLNDIQKELGWDNRDSVYKATKAVLQTIRDRLPVEEVVHFTANLPLVMKGMLMDGYDLKDKPVRMRSVEEFYDYIQQYYDWQRRETIETEKAARAVITVLNRDAWGAAKCGRLQLICQRRSSVYLRSQALRWQSQRHQEKLKSQCYDFSFLFLRFLTTKATAIATNTSIIHRFWVRSSAAFGEAVAVGVGVKGTRRHR